MPTLRPYQLGLSGEVGDSVIDPVASGDGSPLTRAANPSLRPLWPPADLPRWVDISPRHVHVRAPGNNVQRVRDNVLGPAGYATVLYVGMNLEKASQLQIESKSFNVPLGYEIIDEVVRFKERNKLSPMEMIAILGAPIIDPGAMIESDVKAGTRVN
jgi:hypothetical protein